ncbi:tetratricopeptide repeat protein [Kordia sp.]|uniref:tetratricopeptide repeat protein n=1 Tax=Kordia sp. TaxID=1965332 RepID=UPI003D6C2102
MRYFPILLFLLIATLSFSQESVNKLIDLEEKLKKAVSNTEKINALLALAEYELDHNFGRVEYILQEASLLTKNDISLDKRYTALTEVQLGVLKRKKAQYTDAALHYFSALSYFEKIKDTANIADIYHNIGMIHKFQRDYKTSNEYFNKAIQLNNAIKNKLGVGLALTAKGSSYRALKKYKEAESYYTKAKNIFTEINNMKRLEQVNNFLVLLYTKTGRIEEALQLAKHNIARSKKNNEVINLTSNYLNISNVYYKKKEYRLAGKFVDSALKLSKKEGLKQKIVAAYSKKSRLWYQLENYKAAYITHRKFKKHSDSLFNIETTKKLKELELQYKFEQERKEIELITKSEATQKKLYFFLFLLTLISAVLAGLLIKRNYKNRSKIAAEKLAKEQVQKKLLGEKVKVNEEETKRLVADNSMRLEFKQELLNHLKTETLNVSTFEEMRNTVNSIISKLQLQITTEKKFSSIQDKIEDVNKGFDTKLRELYPKLTKTDREICALMRLNLSIKEIATIRNSSIDAVKAARYRIRKKMNLIAGQELEYIIQSL